MQNYHTTSRPTFPVQDQFGRLAFNFGFSKLEEAAIKIAAAMAGAAPGKVEPEALAEESVLIAMAVLDRCHDEAIKDTAKENTTLKLVK